MFLNPRSLLSAALVSLCAFEAAAIDLKPISDPSDLTSSHSKRDVPEGLTLVPISDPGVLTHGRSLRRESPGLDVFDPTSTNSFFWGAYAGNTIYTANFTLFNPDPDEFILAIEHFAKHLKSINCGSASAPMTIEFNDQDSFSYAKSAWQWVNKEDDNKFTLVTKPNQCYEGDDRSPYLVQDIEFDESKLLAKLNAKERPWGEIAHSFRLTLSHEIIDPETENVTHPHLMHMKRETKTLDISTSFNQNLFKYSKDTTGGLDVTADATISTGGQIIADLDIEYSWFIPTDLKIDIKPSGVNAQFLLALQADGKLGSAIDWTLTPEIEIPVGALNIKGILEIGPFVTMGVHFGSSALEGTARAQIGARATIDDSATVEVKLRHPDDNKISGWTPHFERIEPSFTAQIGGNVKAWAELGIQIKAEALGRWGYQASVDAQLPYFEATFSAKADTVNGVCGTTKPFGIDLGADVGINVNLNAGEVDEAPSFKKDLFETKWNLFSTCIGIGPDGVGGSATSAPASNTALPTAVVPSSVVVEPTPVPTPTDIIPTPESSAVVEPPAPTSSVVVDPPAPTSSVVIDPPVVSSVVSEPSVPSSVVVDPPVLSTVTVSPSPVSSVVIEPTASSGVVSPTGAPSSIVVVEPSSSHVVETVSSALPTHIESSTTLLSDTPSPYPVPSSSSTVGYHNSSAPILPTSVEYPVYSSAPAPTSTHGPAYGGHDGGYDPPAPIEKSTTSSKPCSSSTLKSVVKPKETKSTPVPYKPVHTTSTLPHYDPPAPSKSSTPAYPVYTPPAPSSSPAPYVSAPVPSNTTIAYPVYTPPAPTSSSVAVYDPPAPSSSTPVPPAYTPDPPAYTPDPPAYTPAPPAPSSSSTPVYTPDPPAYTPPAPPAYTPDPPAYTPPAPPAYTPPAPPAYTPDPPAYTPPAPPAYTPDPPAYTPPAPPAYTPPAYTPPAPPAYTPLPHRHILLRLPRTLPLPQHTANHQHHTGLDRCDTVTVQEAEEDMIAIKCNVSKR